jgi:hypothetical protein
MLTEVLTVTAIVSAAFVGACILAITVRNALNRAGMSLDAEVKARTVRNKFVDA